MGQRMLTLQDINAADQVHFVALLEGTYEHSPWVAPVCLLYTSRCV